MSAYNGNDTTIVFKPFQLPVDPVKRANIDGTIPIKEKTKAILATKDSLMLPGHLYSNGA